MLERAAQRRETFFRGTRFAELAALWPSSSQLHANAESVFQKSTVACPVCVSGSTSPYRTVFYMTEQADHPRANATNIIAFVPRRKRPKVGIAIRGDFKLEDIPFDSFLGAATNCSARDMTQDTPNGTEGAP